MSADKKIVIAESMFETVLINLVEADIDIVYWQSVQLAGSTDEQEVAYKNLSVAQTNKEMAERRLRSIANTITFYKKEAAPDKIVS